MGKFKFLKKTTYLSLTFLIFSIFLLSTAYSLTCDHSSVIKNVNVGDTPSSETVTCTNSNNYNVTIFSSGDFFSASPSFPIIIKGGFSQTFSLNFNQVNQAGTLSGSLYSSDGLIMNVNVNATTPTSQGGIIVFPTSMIINVQQGQQKNSNLQIVVPQNYPSQITIQSVNFNPSLDLIKFGDLNLGLLNPGQVVNIPLIIDATGVQTGTYSTQINILATNSQGQITLPSVSVQIVVSVGISSATNDTFSIQPQCSLSALEFNLNNSYDFKCTNVVQNIKVIPQYNDYLTGLSAVYGADNYDYTFKANKIGTSTFFATFQYEGSPIGNAFSKDFKITPSGNSPVGGVDLFLQFFQSGLEKTKDNLNMGDTVLVALDNSSRNLVNNFNIFINGNQINGTEINLSVNTQYNLRVTANGYNDYVINNLSVGMLPLDINITPQKSVYYVGDTINLSSNADNVSFLLDNAIITSPYTFVNSGDNLVLQAVKDGYIPNFMNITVDPSIWYSAMTPNDPKTWNKGDSVLMQLTQNVSWGVYYNDTLINNGIGNQVNFRIDNYGNYKIKANDETIFSQDVNYTPSAFIQFISTYWYILVGGFVFLIVIIILIARGGNSKIPSGGISYGGSPGNFGGKLNP